ncbi:hypothetical protein SERLA73DRAFT_86911 [Serpula lacrymans var. lacrymans S7.3]|uniref:3-oxo-5-alpha-steroid 4-dehydrogenase C-terminal domain-containing protein n=2 Tax=Serpula lacrymans var. lacrymans TaxID=341189 RepID=F8PS07_SERL3|nr:uncharacterized protein SERLADRAFT_355191 [Serpula lacrymans var. lacrymans S7.9]EGO00673.1 hypothetical protein SERLA73DRAFT_86911 [Serpula lacrymans var. lacrymans S7.3]EGO26225.1 hypothetical protein SERLADRAFT_355191 [Serpula lacrymans var. lacrymans S7.9]
MSYSSLYETLQKWFFVVPPLISPINFIINAPFGRFAPNVAKSSIFIVDGLKSWIIMEIVSPLTFAYTLYCAPLQNSSSSLGGPQILLAALFLIHYMNRAIISPLRTSSRSKSHISVPMSGISVNVVNGFLLGAYLSSPFAQQFLDQAFYKPEFWSYVTLCVTGLAGNILHDEILLNIRRKAKAKGKGRSEDESKSKGEHYAIPQGYLYQYISYPNYLCEWVEWTGFALASAPLPSLALFVALIKAPSNDAVSALARTVHPPWLFVFLEVFVMLPRAYRGHEWYHGRFPEYPKERKAVIPFLL